MNTKVFLIHRTTPKEVNVDENNKSNERKPLIITANNPAYAKLGETFGELNRIELVSLETKIRRYIL